MCIPHLEPQLDQYHINANMAVSHRDLVDTTPSTGDVLKMFCGPLDKNYFQGGGTLSAAASSASTLILPLTTLPSIELA
jgi:hypothetical protein